MADHLKLPKSTAIMAWADEARAMGVGLPMLLTADLTRLRRLLAESGPDLTECEWGLISHVMDDEAVALLADVGAGELIISATRLAATIVEWADGAAGDDLLRAERLAARARQWTELERWALMVRRRAELVAG